MHAHEWVILLTLVAFLKNCGLIPAVTQVPGVGVGSGVGEVVGVGLEVTGVAAVEPPTSPTLAHSSVGQLWPIQMSAHPLEVFCGPHPFFPYKKIEGLAIFILFLYS